MNNRGKRKSCISCKVFKGYMLNSYIGTELKKKGYGYQIMLRYDPYKKQLRYAEEDDYFVEIKE